MCNRAAVGVTWVPPFLGGSLSSSAYLLVRYRLGRLVGGNHKRMNQIGHNCVVRHLAYFVCDPPSESRTITMRS